MKKPIKELLLECELLLKEKKYDELIKLCQEFNNIDFKESLNTKEEAEECLRIIDYLIQTAEKERTEIANVFVNMNRFKGYLK